MIIIIIIVVIVVIIVIIIIRIRDVVKPVKRSRLFLFYFISPVGQMQSAGKRRMFNDPEMTAL